MALFKWKLMKTNLPWTRIKFVGHFSNWKLMKKNLHWTKIKFEERQVKKGLSEWCSGKIDV
jgi:hypothetical protein